jgi:two-component sensor histidine kinase
VRGDPEVAARPEEKGFGSTLVERSVARQLGARSTKTGSKAA